MADESGVFIRVSNEQVWAKLLEVEKAVRAVDQKVDKTNSRLWVLATVATILVTFISLTGGIQLGG